MPSPDFRHDMIWVWLCGPECADTCGPDTPLRRAYGGKPSSTQTAGRTLPSNNLVIAKQ